METEQNEKKYAPLLPYNGTYGENFTTYDAMPYHCDRDACHPYVGVDPGNMVKYFSYRFTEEPFAIEENLS